MFAKLSLITVAAAATAAALPTGLGSRQIVPTDCKDVHIFLARGWNEPYPGRQGTLTGAICYDLPSCDYEDFVYSTTPEDDYCASVSQGDAAGVAQMEAYAARCPNSKLVLSGYSQGANIAGDVLGGGGGRFGNETVYCTVADHAGLNHDSGAGAQLSAVLLFGDNRHVANQPYNVLSGADVSANNPRFPDSLVKFNQWADITRSYCVHSDPVCAAAGPGPFNVSDHLNYFDLYSNDAAEWVKSIL